MSTKPVNVYRKQGETNDLWWVFLEDRPIIYCDTEEVAESIEGLVVWAKRHEANKRWDKAMKNWDKIWGTPGVHRWDG